jgi:hypothetical protein
MSTKNKITIFLSMAVAIAPSVASLVGNTIPPQYAGVWAAVVTLVASVYHLYQTPPAADGSVDAEGRTHL